jgi:CubicO group peptidase (beta-lactamase class C family)
MGSSPEPGPLPRTEAVVRRGMAAGLHSGGQVHVRAPGGEFAAAVGDSGAGFPMAGHVLMPWYCAARPLQALAAARLTGNGGIRLDAPVAEYVPEFGKNGKEEVTVRQVMLHTWGLRDDPVPALRGRPWQDVMDVLYATPLHDGWRPGEHAAYQTVSYWYVLGELVMRVSGRPLGEYLRQEVAEPLGLRDTWVGMTLPEFEANRGRLGHVREIREFGRVPEEIETPHFVCGHTPFSPRGTARDLAALYALLLEPDRMAAVVEPDLVRQWREPSRTGMLDHSWGSVPVPLDFGLLGMVESRKYARSAQLFGRYCGERTFGHYGYRATVGFADPDAGVAAAFSFAGLPDTISAHLRIQAVCSAIYQDIGG